MDVSPLWIIGDDSHSVAIHRVRRLGHIRLASLALTQAAWLAACAGTLPGVAAPPPRRAAPIPPRAVPAAPASAPGYAYPAAPGVATSAVPGHAPATAAGAPAVTYARPPATAYSPPTAVYSGGDARERQFEIMNEAVAALRQEVARGYERTDALAQDNERLRALVSSLQRDLGRSRSENQALKNQIRSLERQLHEIHTPPPDSVEQPEAAAPRLMPQPSARAAVPPRPANPPANEAPPPEAAGGDFAEPTPGAQ